MFVMSVNTTTNVKDKKNLPQQRLRHYTKILSKIYQKEFAEETKTNQI